MRRALPERIGGALTAAQYADAEQLGVLVDKSGEGVLLQIFTAAVATDRPTLFLEVISAHWLREASACGGACEHGLCREQRRAGGGANGAGRGVRRVREGQREGAVRQHGAVRRAAGCCGRQGLKGGLTQSGLWY